MTRQHRLLLPITTLAPAVVAGLLSSGCFRPYSTEIVLLTTPPEPVGAGPVAADVTAPEPAATQLIPLFTPTPVIACTATPIPTEEPSLPVEHGLYIVQPGDTLWDIALALNVSMQDLIDANPDINPDLLHPDDVLVIPGYASPTPGAGPETLAVTPGPGEAAGYVNTGGNRLRMRAGPGTGEAVIAMLDDWTPLTIIGRTTDFRWLQVVVGSAGFTGWVMREYVELVGTLADVPVTYSETAANPVAIGTPAGQQYPYISGITAHTRTIFLSGQSLGNRANVFSKVGDSITADEAFLVPFGRGNYNLGDHTYLAPVIAFFSQQIARDANSFANTSLAAHGGWSAWNVITPRYADPDYCLAGETPLACEYRVVRPSVALIMLGTNDIMHTPDAQYRAQMREIIETSIDMGVIPVVSTIPPFRRSGYEERVADLNSIIIALAREYDIPLWDYWSALNSLPEDGLSEDGVHPSQGRLGDLRPAYLQYGMNVRNLTALQALDAVWRSAMY